jgi:predicted ATPase/class 3 adenylate cyclase
MDPPHGDAQLPTGTVTLMFTDVESSTEALRSLGSRYKEALAVHHAVLREAIAAHGGTEVNTQGDGLFVVFPSAGLAIDAAAAVQRGLAESRWPDDRPLRVRIGLHTGEPTLTGSEYVGLDVHRAARIGDSAHGGQVVVSAVTRALLDDVQFVDLGRHLLRSFDEPERLFQLVTGEEAGQFPPLRTTLESNLPTLPGRFVGRDAELDQLAALLQATDARVITLVGAGGSGKSRLALEIARRSLGRWAHGVRLVRLAAVEDAALVPAEIARAVDLPAGDDVIGGLREHLHERELLLVIDNLEHLPDAALLLATLLEAAPRLRILATSRIPLRIGHEHVLPVEPLAEEAAVALFVDRACAADGSFMSEPLDERAVRTLCARLDGLPLAIEIAAARVATLSVTDMVDLLEPTLETTGARDLPERQRTLAATIGWSYDLLEPRLRELHGQLAIFQGGFAHEAARSAFDATIDDLETLVAASLLRRLRDEAGRTRLGMLRVVREFALDRLDREGLLAAAQARRDTWLDEVVARAKTGLAGTDPGTLLAELEDIMPDLRASLDDARHRGDRERGIRLIPPLERFWRAHAYVGEARAALTWALEGDQAIRPDLRAPALWTLGRLASAQGNPAAARAPLHEALSLYRELGASREIAFALSELAWITLDRGEIDDAARWASEALALADEADDDRARSSALGALALASAERGESKLARELSERGLTIRRRLGDPLLVANASLTLGSAALAESDLEAAEAALRECLTLARDLGDVQHEAAALCCLGEAAVLRGDNEGALPPLLEALAAFVRLGNDPAAGECLVAVAAATHTDEPARAASLLDAAVQARERSGFASLPVERRLERRARARLGGAAPVGARRLSIVDAALLAGVDPARI